MPRRPQPTLKLWAGLTGLLDNGRVEIDTNVVERTNRVNHFYDSVLYSRLNNKNEDAIILIMQRLHVDDLVGHVLDKDDWTVLDMPAIAEHELTYEIGNGKHYTRQSGEVLHEAREDRNTLEVIKRQLGTPAFEAQYQ